MKNLFHTIMMIIAVLAIVFLLMKYATQILLFLSKAIGWTTGKVTKILADREARKAEKE